MTTLRARTLPDLQVPVPEYDRAALRAGIVHIGVGGFSRSHQAAYLERLAEQGETGWGVCGLGTLPGDRRMRDVLAAQDFLYTLVLKHPDGTVEPRVLGCLLEVLHAPDDPEAAVERLASPGTHVVTLTITEGGYSVDPATGRFDASDARVQADLAPGAVPATVFGLVTAALARRRERGTPPFAVVSCDNIPGNGRIAREAFAGFADALDRDLGAWVRAEVAFPSSMVDRITPATTQEDRELLAARHGVEDGWPVVAEPYLQWVLEDFPGPRPPLERVGVQVVEDVDPYEQLKLRLLNAGHQSIGYLGALSGATYTDEVMADPVFAGFLTGYLEQEATPTLAPVPGVDVADYRRSLLERFGNPAVRDTLARLCAESSDRISTFLLPVVRAQLAAGGDVRRAALVVAAWARYAEGTDEQGETHEVVDRSYDRVTRAVEAGRQDPAAFLREAGVFGELAEDERFVAAYVDAVRLLRERGARAAAESVTER